LSVGCKGGAMPARSGAEPFGPPAAAPVRDAFRTQWRTILRVVGLSAAGAVAYYMTFVYVTTYLRQIDFIAASKALDINTIAVLALMLAIVPMGRLSDRIGRRPVLLAATGGLFVLALPLFWMLHHTNPAILLIGQIGFAVLNAAYWGRARQRWSSWCRAHPLHRHVGRIQSRPRHSRRSDADGRGLCGPPQQQRSFPGLRDHGGGGRILLGDPGTA
jgi:hypothetical protein